MSVVHCFFRESEFIVNSILSAQCTEESFSACENNCLKCLFQNKTQFGGGSLDPKDPPLDPPLQAVLYKSQVAATAKSKTLNFDQSFVFVLMCKLTCGTPECTRTFRCIWYSYMTYLIIQCKYLVRELRQNKYRLQIFYPAKFQIHRSSFMLNI